MNFDYSFGIALIVIQTKWSIQASIRVTFNMWNNLHSQEYGTAFWTTWHLLQSLLTLVKEPCSNRRHTYEVMSICSKDRIRIFVKENNDTPLHASGSCDSLHIRLYCTIPLEMEPRWRTVPIRQGSSLRVLADRYHDRQRNWTVNRFHLQVSS